MKLMSLKKFICEEQNKEFDSFVENVITTNKVPTISAKDFLNEKFNYTGIIYRVVFHPKAEIEKYMLEDSIDTKAITQFISKNFNHDRYAFFSKSINGIKELISYPNLFKINEEHVGVVFSIKPPASIDLTKYQGANIEVKNRLSKTEEVLSFEDLDIKNIDAMYLFDNGWHFVTDFNNRFKSTKFKGSNSEIEDVEDVVEPTTGEENENK